MTTDGAQRNTGSGPARARFGGSAAVEFSLRGRAYRGVWSQAEGRVTVASPYGSLSEIVGARGPEQVAHALMRRLAEEFALPTMAVRRASGRPS